MNILYASMLTPLPEKKIVPITQVIQNGEIRLDPKTLDPASQR